LTPVPYVSVSPRVFDIQLKIVVLPTLVIPIIPHFNAMSHFSLAAKLPKRGYREPGRRRGMHFLLILREGD